ncbi:MAG: PilZ domain-containing protein [Gemmatimonadota bacterium]
MTQERRFIRHTVDVPLEVHPDFDGSSNPAAAAATAATATAKQLAAKRGVNVSTGGLAFIVEECLTNGDIVRIRIPTVRPPFEARARVVWCRNEGDAFLAGVEFLDAADAFRARMVEQVCAVEQYRQKVREEEGRSMTPQEAATEWIEKYAGSFPSS